MSVEAMAIVLHHSRARGTAKVVLLGIANHDGDGGAWPTMRTLARYANVDVRNARKAVAKLVQLGEVRVEVQGGGTLDWDDELRPNRYDVLVSCPPACDRTKNHRMPGESITPALWKDPRTKPPGGTNTPGGPPDETARQTTQHQPHHQVGASTTDRARDPGPRCRECGQHEDRCTSSQARLHLADRHPFTPPRKDQTA